MRSLKIRNDILDILSDNRRHTIMEIAEEIEVNYNTVQRHIADLSLRYPIEVRTGGRDTSGVRLKEVCLTMNKLLTNEELSILIKMLDSFEDSKEICSIRQKLTPYLPKTNTPHADTPATPSERSEKEWTS